jgi:NADPH:quinone reductase-like Zn-dependent oxidoreductase
MRALVLADFGATPVVQDLDVPEPAEGEVRVRVRAASVNGFDLAVAGSYLRGAMEHRFPVVLGKDFAGTVDAVGPGVDGFAVGDRVFGVVTKPELGDGSFGEYVTVAESIGLAPLPEEIGYAEGAALGLAGTAAAAAVDAAELADGSTVLVAGATGGVGSQVVQLAVAAGARVLATAATDAERAHVTGLGATEVIDHTGDVSGQVRAAYPDGIDAVVHLAGDPAPLLPVLKPQGRFVSTLLMSAEQLPAGDVKVAAIYAQPVREVLDRLAANQAGGATRVTIQRTYGLEDAPQALADFGQGTLGKLVVTVD